MILISNLNGESWCIVAMNFYLKFILLCRHVSNKKKRCCINHGLSFNVLLFLVEV